ncbi:metallophosphoesterase family protein [Spirosoma foliorum]|uniref:Metallophosphoesterase family protein n=1 Tax=Spirosoma foliorum TaxID=2710596 RepID=A0A7G5H375_9BACT|nr:metallophosphoesterase family protein [Spirosoma foliorum]QMW05567.1 metallophosphoesterase family protein [Spirosoma foliorum]
MLKIAILSDIHGNLPAFKAVLNDIDAQGVDQVFCLGDLVDFAPWPNEVIDLLRKNRIPSLLGNHDERIAFDLPIIPLQKHNAAETEARVAAITNTRQVIHPENKRFLASLPRELMITFSFQDTPINILLVHASTRSIDEYIYESHDQADLITMMNERKADVLLMGHTHQSYIRRLETESGTKPSSIKMAINCGSVGRTKEATASATYLLLTVSDQQAPYSASSIQYDLIRVDYPIEQTIQAIRRSDIPDFYADFLAEKHKGHLATF